MMNSNQAIPLRVHDRDDHLVVVAPMPGLQPEDIGITVLRNRIVLHGKQRGTNPGDHLLLAEWRVGPYARELPLPVPVRGALANATYGNGVLVISLPKAGSYQSGSKADFRLQPVHAAAGVRGEHVGYQGKAIRETTTEKHARKHEVGCGEHPHEGRSRFHQR